MKKLALGASLFALLLCSVTSANAAVIYQDSDAFKASFNSTIVDDYEHPGYQQGFYNESGSDEEGSWSFSLLWQDDMNAVVGETRYSNTSGGFPNPWSPHTIWSSDLYPGNHYCAGCNGSFLLDFTNTSIGDSNGVQGAGFDLVYETSIFGFVTYGDGSTENFDLSDYLGFWGIYSELNISTIHIGLENGGSTFALENMVSIDNLIIGNDRATVPEPSGLLLSLFGLAALFAKRKLVG